jgi:hypothetical protein
MRDVAQLSDMSTVTQLQSLTTAEPTRFDRQARH